MATRRENYKIAVLPIEKHELRWVNPFNLVLADTGDVFDLCAMAYRTDHRELQRACEQAVEHDKPSYWVQRYRTHQLRLEENLDQAISGPSGTKRTRSPNPSTNSDDDLYSSPSSAKKSRTDDKTAKMSFSESSVTLKDDSQSSKPSLSMEKTPSKAEVRRMRDKVFMSKFATPQQNKDGQKGYKNRKAEPVQFSSSSAGSFLPASKPRRFLDTLVDSTRFDGQMDESDSTKNRLPEYLGSGSLLGVEFIAGSWTVEQDAELIRLKERLTPTPSWLQIVDILRTKFPNEAMFRRMNASQPRHHYDRMIKEGATTSQGNVSLNGLRYRKAALAFLHKEDSEQAQSLKNRGYHKYTKEEDSEIIRLKEVAMPNKVWAEIADAFHKKFPVLSNSNNRGALLRARYSVLEPESSQHEEDPSADSDSDESEAEEVREDWLAGSSACTSSARWSRPEDAELIRLRERTEPFQSWQDIRDALNVKFHCKAVETKPRTSQNTRDRWRYINGEKPGSKNGLEWRNKALALLDGGEASLEQLDNAPNAKLWSKEEDVELVKLRDQELPGTSWAEIAEIYNARLHTRPDHKDRSESSLWHRYDKISIQWKQSATAQSVSMLAFVRMGGMDGMGKSKSVSNIPSKAWTTAQDVELVQLKESMPGKNWHDVANAFQSIGEKKGWHVRSADTIRARYSKELRPDRIEDQVKSFASTQSASGCPPRAWTPVEDKELVRLRRSMSDKIWADVAVVYNGWLKIRGDGQRSSESLQRRYQRLSANEQFKKLPFEVVADASSTLSESMPQSKFWTSAEDEELMRLRKKMSGQSWPKVAEAFVDQNRGKGWRERSGPSLSSRYESLNAQGKVSKPSVVITIDDDDNPVPVIQFGSRSFTPEEDGELILLREKMGDQAQWSAIVKDFNKKFPLSPRSRTSLTSRYLDFLQEDTCRRPNSVNQRQRAINALRQKGIEHSVEIQISSSSSTTPKKFTPEEDGALILLREKFRGPVRWDEIREDYNAKFPDNPRTSGSLSSRYTKVLTELALEQLQGGVNQRDRALAELKKQGIELQVNDPISDSSSEEDEDDEEEEDQAEEDDDELDDNGIQVTILIGENKDRFTVPLSRIETNRYFLDDEYEDPTDGHLIQGHRWAAIRPKNFIPVHEFLLRGEFTPPLSPNKKSLVGLATDAEDNMHLLLCAQVFVLARQLLMWDLAALAISKFKLLKKEAVYLLKSAEMVFSEPVSEQETDGAMRKLLVEEMAKRYWEFAGSQPTNMQDVMRKSPLFEAALYERKAEMAKERYDKMEWE
ncbi:hypothetical protein E6O75_ATG04376 [Venturia nashicola]|uniref:Myb-like domain-containing protein n=1 Tax=Venturia nashicola TaxID=86259 RepID=A0A4Z1PI09_9PEZI|nr:hypothetical protein E6O75_ATG04376 [Venturia nashicola]